MLLGVFDKPALLQLASFCAFSFVAWLLGYGLLRLLHARFGRDAGMLPVAPSFVSVTMIFALFLGFLAADIWAQKHRAQDAAYDERSAIEGIETIAGPSGLDAAAVAAAAETYRRQVIDTEWGAHRNRISAPAVDAAMQALSAAVVELAKSDAPASAVGHLFSLVGDIADARAERLAIGVNSDRLGNTSWFSVIMLALFSYIAIVCVHMDRPRAGTLAISVFAVATTFAFWFLAMHDSPYTGGVRLDPVLLLRIAGSTIQ